MSSYARWSLHNRSRRPSTPDGIDVAQTRRNTGSYMWALAGSRNVGAPLHLLHRRLRQSKERYGPNNPPFVAQPSATAAGASAVGVKRLPLIGVKSGRWPVANKRTIDGNLADETFPAGILASSLPGRSDDPMEPRHTQPWPNSPPPIPKRSWTPPTIGAPR